MEALVIIGMRPEIIKMASVVKELSDKGHEVKIDPSLASDFHYMRDDVIIDPSGKIYACGCLNNCLDTVDKFEIQDWFWDHEICTTRKLGEECGDE